MTESFGPGDSAYFDLSAHAKLRLTGADRVRYLNGQTSNDVRKATAEQAIHACVLNAKGRINADVFICTAGDAVLLSTAPEARESLNARLERYIIADDVQLEDVTEEFALFHLVGPDIPDLQNQATLVRADRFGCAGTDIWVAAASKELVRQELQAAWPFCDDERAEVWRIERGIPRWGRELTDEIIPPEAGLEAAVIDYAKGCYIGQEVISRMKMSGQTNKRLCGFIAADDAPLAPGSRLTSDGKDVGWITSATRSQRLGKQIALGFAKRGSWDAGSRLNAVAEGSAEPIAVEVVALPFVR